MVAGWPRWGGRWRRLPAMIENPPLQSARPTDEVPTPATARCWSPAGDDLVGADRAAAGMRRIVDAASYFSTLKRAVLAAERRVLFIGWDFDPRIRMDPLDGTPPRRPAGRGARGAVRANPELEIGVLQWDLAMLVALGRGLKPTCCSIAARPTASVRRRQAPPDRRCPPPEDRGDRRLPRVRGRHRHHGRPVGHLRPSGRPLRTGAARSPASRRGPGTTSRAWCRARRPVRSATWPASAGRAAPASTSSPSRG